MNNHVECPKCKKRLEVANFFEHLLQHDNEKITSTSVQCPFCQSKQIEIAFIQHLRDAHSDKFITAEIKTNIPEKSKGIKVKCPCCSKDIKLKGISKHIKYEHHGKENLFFRCALCRNKTFQLSEFTEHLSTHFPEVKFTKSKREEPIELLPDDEEFTMETFESAERKEQFKRYLKGFIIYTPMKG